jgi:hypothetical protein
MAGSLRFANGALQCEIGQGGHSLDIDQTDGSPWVAGMKNVYHYSRQGTTLARFSGMSSDQKYIVVVPGSDQQNEQHAPPNSR